MKPAELRFELSLQIDDLQSIAAAAEARSGLQETGLVHIVEELARLVEVMSDDELGQVCEHYQRFPSLWNLPRDAAIAVASVPVAEPGAIPCTTMSRENYIVVFYLLQSFKIAEVIADGVCDVLSCSPPPTCLTCAVIATITKALVLTLGHIVAEDSYGFDAQHHDFVGAEIDSSAARLLVVSSKLQSKVSARLDETLSSRARQSDLALLLNLSSLRFEALGEELQESRQQLAGRLIATDSFATLDRRLRVEGSLQDGAPGPISSLQLPASLGGGIEQVREIVASTIQMSQSAGEDVAPALAHFALADQFLNQQLYSKAFERYRLAYQSAAREPQPREEP